MAPREPVRAQAQELANEEIEGQDTEVEGQDDEGQGADAAEHLGEEQEVGQLEDVDDELEAEPPTRGSNRFQRLANENRELQQRLQDLERRGAPQPQVQQPQGETEEQFAARVAMLPPDERMEQRLIRAERFNQARMHAVTLQTQDMTDKIAFDAKATVDARYKRYAPEVERRRSELMAQGQMVPREAILKFVIGERVLANQGTKEAKRQQARGQERVARQQTRPTGGRSDVQGGGRRPANEAEARRRRLEGMDI
jgi:hypothetical protein